MAINSANRARLFATTPLFYRGPASVLAQTGGLVFPLTPTISYSQVVNYSPYDLVHTNYSFNTYRNTPSPMLQIQAEFTNTTFEEHAYTQGVLHFLRSVTKMFYGANEGTNPAAGTPPPVLRFSAYGPQIFNNVPVVVSNVATTFDPNVDLIEGNGGIALPAVMVFAIDLMVQQSPARQKQQFTTSGFINGQMYNRGFI
jgi:hypothetical protein